MEYVSVSTWEEFEAELRKILSQYKAAQHKHYPACVSELLFRGHQDSDFKLDTTLERYSREKKTSFRDYYHLILRVKPQIETFTGKTWTIPAWDEFHKSIEVYDNGKINPEKRVWESAYSYLIYLRHHGFPSPLLDWSRSPYVATYFAFKSITPPASGSEKVSIFIYWDAPDGCKSGWAKDASITTWGPYINSHKRHFLQQGDYTICTQFDQTWHFVPHDEVFKENSTHQDFCWKIDVPYSERNKVLAHLDSYNLNAFSLFDSEETLMETMALREINFRSAFD